MATVMLLQAFEGLSDAEATDRLSFDLRWQAAAGVDTGYESFHPTSLVGQRNRLRASARPRRLFEDTKVVAKETGALKSRARVLDSTPLYDAVATQDTVTQLRAAIRKLLAALDQAASPLAAAVRAALLRDDEYATVGKPPCDWDDKAAREALVDALGARRPGRPRRPSTENALPPARWRPPTCWPSSPAKTPTRGSSVQCIAPLWGLDPFRATGPRPSSLSSGSPICRSPSPRWASRGFTKPMSRRGYTRNTALGSEPAVQEPEPVPTVPLDAPYDLPVRESAPGGSYWTVPLRRTSQLVHSPERAPLLAIIRHHGGWSRNYPQFVPLRACRDGDS